MSLNRIQKLLFSEYKDFEDMVLVESPFAQTTRDGDGIRQLNLGLTPTKLVIATDILPPAEESNILCDPNIDPIIETLELVSLYHIDCVNLSIFRRKKRQSLKAHFCNNYITYFEIGGFDKRKMFWNLWCERVKFLNPDDNKSSRSETSVATSTSSSALRLISSKLKVENGKSVLWMEYGPAEKTSKCIWENVPSCEIARQFDILPNETDCAALEIKSNSNETKVKSSQSVISEEISTTTTSVDDLIIQDMAIENFAGGDANLRSISDSAIRNFEESKLQSITKLIESRRRHPRKYGYKPNSHFLNGFGPWNLHPGDRYSVQRKRSMSAVRVRRQPNDINLCLPISKRLLTSTISSEAFHIDPKENNNGNLNKLSLPKQPLVYFWTPDYWYRPQTPQQAYSEYIQYISKLRANVEQSNNKMKKMVSKRPRWLRRKKKNGKEFTKIYDNSINFNRMKSVDNMNEIDVDFYMSAVQYIRQAMKSPAASQALDFDSSCLAYELTMIDKDLFLKIEPYELECWVSYRSSRNIPNINTFIAFSHRVSNLVASEILREDSLKLRAKVIIRFINVANKCERIKNFHSCISVLNGLQCGAIYRLHCTWAYVRKYYSMKYLLFETLCRLYNDPRLPKYQESFSRALKSSGPYLPSIGDVIARLMGNIVLHDNIDDKDDYSQLLEDNIVEYTKTIAKRKQKYFKQRSVHTMAGHRQFCTQNKFMCFLSNRLKTKTTKNISTLKTEKILFPTNDVYNSIKNTASFLRKCQKAATKYALSTNVMAREFLLRARYQEDKINFYNSFSLEPKLSSHTCN